MKNVWLVPFVLSLVLVTGCIQEAKWAWHGDADSLADEVSGDSKGDGGTPDVSGGDTPGPKDTTDTIVPADAPSDTALPPETVDLCGNGECEGVEGESPATCPTDCCPSACGDGVCQKEACGESIGTSSCAKIRSSPSEALISTSTMPT